VLPSNNLNADNHGCFGITQKKLYEISQETCSNTSYQVSIIRGAENAKLSGFLFDL